MSNRIPFRWREWAVVALAMALAWGLRGQHGHERGAALVGAMAGLSLAAVTGAPRWIGGAVVGSLAFAIGGSLSYGRFVEAAYRGSWEAIGALALIGFAWGGLGTLGLALGLTQNRYRFWEKIAVGIGLFLVWFLVDQFLWGRLTGPDDFAAREKMGLTLLAAWVLVAAYAGFWKGERRTLELTLAGAAGFGIGFPLAAWVQGAGSASGIALNWWKVGEHLIGFCGGASLGLVALKQQSNWILPMPVRPLDRWGAVAWLLWLIPCWLIANNLDYWIAERTLFPVSTGKAVWVALLLLLLSIAVWGALEIRRGRIFAISWMPRHLRALFLTFLWLTTAIASSKSLAAGGWGPVPTGFLLLAFAVTLLARRRLSPR